jgi:predicted nucleotidyltransferase
MESSLTDSILSVCRTLNKFSVEYIIVGGTAVALHGYYRHSMNVVGEIAEKPDLDFWYNPTYDNYFKLLNALEDLGQDVTKFKEEQTPNPKRSFFRYEFEKFTLDFLPELKASLKFRPSFSRREIVTLNDTEIPFINYEDLILDKKANARSKDITDLEQLDINRKKNKE